MIEYLGEDFEKDTEFDLLMEFLKEIEELEDVRTLMGERFEIKEMIEEMRM